MRIPIHGEGKIQDRGQTITYQANDDGLLLIGGNDEHGRLIQPSTILSLITGIAEYIIEYVRGLVFDITVHKVMKTIGLDLEKYYLLQNNITCPLLPTSTSGT